MAWCRAAGRPQLSSADNCLAESAARAVVPKPESTKQSSGCTQRRHGDQTQKLGANSAYARAGLVVSQTTPSHEDRGPAQLSRVICHRTGGEWWPVKVTSDARWMRACTSDDIPFVSESIKWWWVPVRRDWGFVVIAPDVEVPHTVAATQSPIFTAMWAIAHEHAGTIVRGVQQSARPLKESEMRDERRILGMQKSQDSCVYLSLYHLAIRQTTRAWLLDQAWGAAKEDKITELCRGWVAREDRPIHITEVRKKNQNSTAASPITVARFVPYGSDGSGYDTLLVMKVSPEGAPVQGHAVPICGSVPIDEFGFPSILGFVGMNKSEPEVVIVDKKKRVEQPVLDEPAERPNLPPQQKRPKKWVQRDPEEASSSLRDVVTAIEAEERAELARQIDAAFDKANFGVGSEEDDDPVCLDCGDKFASWSKETTPDGRCKPCRSKQVERQQAPIDLGAPVAPPGRVPQMKAEPKEKAPEGNEKRSNETGTSTMTGSSDFDCAVQTDPDETDRWIWRNPPIFEGIVLQNALEVEWRQGWWRNEDREFLCSEWAIRKIPFVGRPDFCSATMDYVAEWGVNCLYFEVKPRDGLTFIKNGIVTDGVRSVQTFKEGSVVKVRGQVLTAKKIKLRLQGQEVTALKLVRVASGTFVSLLAGRWFLGKPRLLAYEVHGNTVDSKVFNACKWQGAVKTERDPLTQGFLQIARANENGRPRPADPDTVVPILRQLAECYEKPEDVSGPFKWGYCYSGCGKERPGKFYGRICPDCEKRNTVLAEWVAQGLPVCTALNPVRYPGVVKTQRQNPPLKKGAETDAVYGREYVVTKRVGGKEVVVSEEEIANAEPVKTPGPRLGGIGIDTAAPFATASGIRPLVDTVKYRMFKSLPGRKVNPEAFSRATNLLDTMLPRLTRQEVILEREKMFEEMLRWVQSMRCARRRKALMRALLELRNGGWVPPRDWNIIKPFVKSENLPHFKAFRDWMFGLTFNREAYEYVPRPIQAPSDYSHLVAGPYLKPMVGGLKDDWCWTNWIFYASVCPEKLDKWLGRIRKCQSFFWSDYTAFDATYSAEAWNMIETVYKRCLPEASQEFWRIIDAWRTPEAQVTLRKSGYTLKYKGRVCNCSGRDDTALANALLNGIVLGLSFAAALSGVSLTELQPEHVENAKGLVKIAIVGDDSLVGCDFDVAEYKDAIESNIKEFGLIAKTETSDWIGDVTFLGMMPYPVEGGSLQWGPTIGRRAYKAFWQCDPVGSLPAWTRGVAQQLMLCRNVPLLYEMAKQVDGLLAGHKVTKQVVDPNRVWSSRTEGTRYYSPTAISWLCRRYEPAGLTADMIYRDLGIISTITRLPAVVKLESIERMLCMDDL